MSNGSRRRLSRGDRRRNEKLARLREIITRETAVVSFDLAADKQVAAVCDPDSRVLARRTVKAKACAVDDDRVRTALDAVRARLGEAATRPPSTLARR